MYSGQSLDSPTSAVVIPTSESVVFNSECVMGDSNPNPNPNRKRRAGDSDSVTPHSDIHTAATLEQQSNSELDTSNIDLSASSTSTLAPSVPEAMSRKKAKRSVEANTAAQQHRRRDSKASKGQNPVADAPTLPSNARIIVRDGMRYITPYCHPLEFFIKKRWWGRGLLDMLRSEYKNPLPHFYDELLEAGRIILKPAARHSKEIHSVDELRSRSMLMNDHVTVRLHRHEPPVPDQTIQILHYQPSPVSSPPVSDSSASSILPPPNGMEPPHSLPSETIVINKPAGMPVHASGRYLHNTVVGILKQQLGIDVTPVHRLDRITSGLLMLSLTRTNARSLGYELQHRLVHKEYLARVKGQFPSGITRVQGVMELRGEANAKKDDTDVTSKSSVSSSSSSFSKVFVESSGGKSVHTFVTPANPFMSAHVPTRLQLDVTSQDNAAVAHPSSSSTTDVSDPSMMSSTSLPDPSRVTSATEFEFVSYDGVSSLVKCRPLTGRTHQIRLHLSSLGFPIANDFLYGGSLFESNTYQDQSAQIIPQQVELNKLAQAGETTHSSNDDIAQPPPDEVYEDWCSECRQLKEAASTNTELANNDDRGKSSTPAIFCSSIWLHCSKYSGPHWSYHAPPPAWAESNFDSRAAMAVSVHAHGNPAEEEPEE